MTKGKLFCFYIKDGGLFWRQYLNDVWSETGCIKKEGVTNFSVNLCEGKILILCQNASYVEKISFDNGVCVISTLVSGGLAGQYYGINLDSDDVYVIHNIPVQGESSQILMSHNVSAKGIWSNSKHLGRIVPFTKNNAFWVIPVYSQHYLIFYQAVNSTSGVDLGYREIYGASKMGDFRVIHPQVNINNQNFSFLADTGAVHMAYITKNMLNTVLVYRRLDARGLSPKIIVSQGHQIHSPLVYTRGGIIHIVFMKGTEMFECSIVEDSQLSASPPIRNLKNNLQNNSIARFLQDDTTKDMFSSNEIYVNSDKPWDIQLFTEIYHMTEKHNHNTEQNNNDRQLTLIGSQKDYDSFFENTDGKAFAKQFDESVDTP